MQCEESEDQTFKVQNLPELESLFPGYFSKDSIEPIWVLESGALIPLGSYSYSAFIPGIHQEGIYAGSSLLILTQWRSTTLGS